MNGFLQEKCHELSFTRFPICTLSLVLEYFLSMVRRIHCQIQLLEGLESVSANVKVSMRV